MKVATILEWKKRGRLNIESQQITRNLKTPLIRWDSKRKRSPWTGQQISTRWKMKMHYNSLLALRYSTLKK